MLWICFINASQFKTTLMAEIIMNQGGRQRGGVKRMKRHYLRIDMTPMVDLGFLLITFFVMTVEMSKPVATKLNMPKDSKVQGTEVPESASLTVLLGHNRDIWYYHGFLEDALKENRIYKTTFSYKNGLGDIIREKQIELDNNPLMKEGRGELTILLKPASNANYTGIIDVLDEVTINGVKRYALMKITNEEKVFLKQKEQ
jgi:biopolymer transport protein ExbD